MARASIKEENMAVDHPRRKLQRYPLQPRCSCRSFPVEGRPAGRSCDDPRYLRCRTSGRSGCKRGHRLPNSDGAGFCEPASPPSGMRYSRPELATARDRKKRCSVRSESLGPAFIPAYRSAQKNSWETAAVRPWRYNGSSTCFEPDKAAEMIRSAVRRNRVRNAFRDAAW